jgi:hypothetical protein
MMLTQNTTTFSIPAHDTNPPQLHIMPETMIPPSADILALPQEDHIQLAIVTIKDAGYKANGDQCLSTRQAAKMYDVPHSTLADRMKGLPTRAEAHVSQQNLSPAEEEVLVKWAKVMGHRGVPLTYSTLTQYASEISGKHIGEVWPKRFLAQHPDLKIKTTTSLEKFVRRLSIVQQQKGFMIFWNR